MSHPKEGTQVPDVTFRMRDENGWLNRSTQDLFAGKTVVVFALPGAFTPTCSTAHVPRYNQLFEAFKAAGVDDILCVSVNDAFVMNAWKEAQEADHITFVPDGNGEFSQKMGMLVGKEDLGFGPRSWRYSMLVKDGKVEKVFSEPDKPGDPYEVSDADTMLEYLGGKAGHDIVLFTKLGCGHCARAKKALAERKLEYVELPATPQVLRALPGTRSTPQVFIDGEHVGTADDLEKWLASH